MFDDDDSTIYLAVVNHEEQYSIWPEYKQLPNGWTPTGKRGTKQECLDFIESVWVDMRPLSLRKKMAELAESGEGSSLEESEDWDDAPPLVDRLSLPDRPLAASRAKDAAELKEQIDRGYVLLKFTETRGGTELGIRLSREQCHLESADFSGATGNVRLVGSLTLDYVPVELVANVDLSTLRGAGQLRRIDGNT